MRNQILIYILFAACLLSACRSEFYDFDSETDDTREEFSLTVAVNDIEVSDGITSRAEVTGCFTIFKENDCVGLIILDRDGNLLADNVPYKYDGRHWVFDADNEEGRERVYFDATMYKYIVYYPYHSSVNGVKDEDAIKELEQFEVRENQKDKDDFRFSDLMISTYEGEAINDLNVNLNHVRNSFSLDVKLRWDLGLPNGDVLGYHPVIKALVDFKVRDGDHLIILNDSINKTFEAPDGSFRYILPDKDEKRMVTWRYTYRGESFGGGSEVAAGTGGVRFVHHTSASISRDKVEPYDYYSVKKIGDDKYGFVLPWDAVECFGEYHPVGIVFYAGHHGRDESDYSESGIAQSKCHGYVVALSDAGLAREGDNMKLEWAVKGSDAAKTYVTLPKLDGKFIWDVDFETNAWSGFMNMKKIREFSGSADEVDESQFPAARAAELYNESKEYEGILCNTSGWFLPTYHMLTSILIDGKFSDSFDVLVGHEEIQVGDKGFFDEMDLDGYWTCTEGRDSLNAYYKMADKTKITSALQSPKEVRKSVRPVLAF